MDQINIVNDKMHHCTQISVVLICEENPPVKTQVNRTLFNEMLYGTVNPDGILEHIIDGMVETAIESLHLTECKSCTNRVKPLMGIVKNAIEDKGFDEGYITYCVVNEVFPAFRQLAGNYPVVSNLGFERYQVHVRRFEMVLNGGTAQDSLAGLAKQLPGVKAKVKYPCGDIHGTSNPCGCIHGTSKNHTWGGDTIMNVVIHLNDEHRWTREEIADWLESVDDPEQGIDLAFNVPEEEEQ